MGVGVPDAWTPPALSCCTLILQHHIGQAQRKDVDGNFLFSPSFFSMCSNLNQELEKTVSYTCMVVEVPDRLQFQLQTQSHPGNRPLWTAGCSHIVPTEAAPMLQRRREDECVLPSWCCELWSYCHLAHIYLSMSKIITFGHDRRTNIINIASDYHIPVINAHKILPFLLEIWSRAWCAKFVKRLNHIWLAD